MVVDFTKHRLEKKKQIHKLHQPQNKKISKKIKFCKLTFQDKLNHTEKEIWAVPGRFNFICWFL